MNFLPFTAQSKFMEFVSDLLVPLKDFAISASWKLVGAFLVLVIGMKVANWVVKLITNGKAFLKIDKSAQTFLKSILNISIKALVLVCVGSILGVPATSVITLLGSAGLAIGLALQGSLANFAGGMMILLFKPFAVGDYITAGDVSGTVKSISIFYTKIVSVDNKRVVVPNSLVSNQPITNFSCYPTRRVDLTIDVAYDSDIETVKKILFDIANNHPKALKDPEPMARISDYKDSSISFSLRVWCNNEDYWDLSFDLKEQIVEKFKENNIVIPFAQLDVHISK